MAELKRRGFHAEPPEDGQGFRLNADGPVRSTPPGDSSTAFLGYDLGAGAAVPGGIMFNVRAEQNLPGLHNFKPPEEAVPVADLSAVAEAGRETKEKFRALAVSPIAARLYLAATLGLNVGQGGTFDYQRRGNRITGYTHLQQFEKVSNLNVGLFAQQAGLTLEEVLDIAGLFARNFSGNADPSQPYGLSATQLKFITRGYQIGESGMFDRPPMR